jgi:dTDP-4-amino-4,6-dideoxygalactose transaminase
MFVGGEFYDDPTWEKDSPTLDTAGMTFLNGGKACLTVIADYLLDHGTRRILLPSYLCPTVLATLEHQGIDWEMYPVCEDFSIDLDDLARRAAGFGAVYFINYFGFQHPPEVRRFFQSLRQKGVTVVEDNAQAGFASQTTGDFVFNSMRKFTAHDGGYLISPHDVTPYLEKHRGVPNRRLPLIRAYRSGLRRYLFEDEEDEYDDLQSLFERAETVYAADPVVWGDAQERAAIERMDWQSIRRVRRENYRYLLKLIAAIPEIKPIFPTLQEDNMPLGLPVYISGVSRDRVNDELGDSQIGLTIHWDEILTHPYARSQPLAADMASRILTLTIDQRTSRAQLEYLALHLVRAVENAKSARIG